MKYMVKECHPGYAVVLSEDGRFLKVANMHYEVGQTVTNVIEIQVPSTQKSTSRKKRGIYAFTTIASLAACLILVFTLMFRANQTYASVYVTINPEVRIDVNRKDIVIRLEGMNEDGNDLIDGYFYQHKSLESVLDELADRAIELGYLHEGGRITLTLDSENNEWVVTHSDTLTNHLGDYLQEKLTITIDVTDTVSETQQIIIPVEPIDDTYNESDYGEITPAEVPASESTPNDSHYDDGDSNYQNPGNNDSNYEDSGDGDSSYEDSDDDD